MYETPLSIIIALIADLFSHVNTHPVSSALAGCSWLPTLYFVGKWLFKESPPPMPESELAERILYYLDITPDAPDVTASSSRIAWGTWPSHFYSISFKRVQDDDPSVHVAGERVTQDLSRHDLKLIYTRAQKVAGEITTSRKLAEDAARKKKVNATLGIEE